MSMPAAKAGLALVWRRSCSRIAGRPARKGRPRFVPRPNACADWGSCRHGCHRCASRRRHRLGSHCAGDLWPAGGGVRGRRGAVRTSAGCKRPTECWKSSMLGSSRCRCRRRMSTATRDSPPRLTFCWPWTQSQPGIGRWSSCGPIRCTCASPMSVGRGHYRDDAHRGARGRHQPLLDVAPDPRPQEDRLTAVGGRALPRV